MHSDSGEGDITASIVIEFERGPTLKVSLRRERTQTIIALTSSLPFASKANRWGDEVYFEGPFHSPLEADARAEMAIGEVAFWPDGDAVALFFGPTPVSSGREPRAYSPCNLIGSIEGDAAVLAGVKQGQPLKVSLE
ncbi:MAG: hypothetical protein MUC90_06780 [Thermoplasmata archaeon]|jgi:hypothetical protein|nr:hypothetical protein [Thermoplasmata archaeon]